MKIKKILFKKSYEFALKIIKLHKSTVFEYKEYVLSKQILRSGTSIRALVKETEHAQ
jgi:four helix bundle protein